jgi:PPOX class probable F420-dependent enzyme
VTPSLEGKYLSLTSFKSDGTGVATPVYFVQEEERVFVKADGDSWKVKRIARDPSVTVALCSASGRIRGEPVRAHAEVLPETEAPRLEELMARKYRLERLFVDPLYRLISRIRGVRARGKDSVWLAIAPSSPSMPEEGSGAIADPSSPPDPPFATRP